MHPKELKITFVVISNPSTMYSDARKIHLLEAVLRVKDEATLVRLEEVLAEVEPSTGGTNSKPTIYDFLGMVTPAEAIEMRAAIHATSEQIHPDDWK